MYMYIDMYVQYIYIHVARNSVLFSSKSTKQLHVIHCAHIYIYYIYCNVYACMCKIYTCTMYIHAHALTPSLFSVKMAS